MVWLCSSDARPLLHCQLGGGLERQLGQQQRQHPQAFARAGVNLHRDQVGSLGFLRKSGRVLYAFMVVPVALWGHLSKELGIATPDMRIENAERWKRLD